MWLELTSPWSFFCYCDANQLLHTPLMVGTCTFIPPHVTGSTSRTGSWRWRILIPSSSSSSSKKKKSMAWKGVVSCRSQNRLSEGPSCIFVGPLETANKELLETFYQQARDAYYSGDPLIVDDMFDKVELKLRCYGSKSVVKYPRCSLKRQSTYSDAEEDLSQVLALASVWTFLLAFGSFALLMPMIYTIGLAYQDAVNSRLFPDSIALDFMGMTNGTLFMGLGSLIGYPIASSSVRALEDLWRSDLVALKGSCPNCGEEVFAFVRAEQSNKSPHRSDCHVCECTLEYRTKVEQSISRPGRHWVYGRVYLVPGTAAKRQR